MKLRLALCLLAVAAPALAQPVPAPVNPAADAGGLTGSVSDENAWRNLGVAIPAFATDHAVATAAAPGDTAALGREIAGVIAADLRNNGLFKPTGPEALPPVAFAAVPAPGFAEWRARGAEMLLQGYVRAGEGGQLTVGCYLYDVALGKELTRAGWVLAPAEWRRAAHKCADLVYGRLSGENPFFDSRIAYIAETGPKEHRRKQLAIMDADGANHRFLTSGQTIALTPRFSPDYRSILYLSYLDGRPRIYVYDLASGRQRLVTENRNPTFAPRWSPDGKWILFSMGVAGSTNIYRVSASGGGEPQRLTDTPGISIGGSYSPDGRRIVFESDRSGTQQVYVMDADGANPRRISFFAGRAATPEWSPRGDLIAFTHIAGDFHVAVMTPAGAEMRDLTAGWQDEAPTFAPNGRVIQFFRTERHSGKAAVWQVDLTGRNERRLPTPVDASDPAWGPVLP